MLLKISNVYHFMDVNTLVSFLSMLLGSFCMGESLSYTTTLLQLHNHPQDAGT